jgi:hypothetical protein
MYLHVCDIVQCPCSLDLKAALTVRYNSTLQGTKMCAKSYGGTCEYADCNFGTPFHARCNGTPITGVNFVSSYVFIT